MKTNVRGYTDQQLLNRVESLDTFQYFPSDYWLIGVRSEEDEYNKFDDKFYLFRGRDFIRVYSGTTHTGAKGLKNFETYNKEGVAVLKSDTIVYNSHRRSLIDKEGDSNGLGMSKGREVYRQYKSFPYFRDGNKNEKVEEIGEEKAGIIHAHIHCSKNKDRSPRTDINGWSLGCQVFNDYNHWEDFFDNHTFNQEFITLCILKEFEV